MATAVFGIVLEVVQHSWGRIYLQGGAIKFSTTYFSRQDLLFRTFFFLEDILYVLFRCFQQSSNRNLKTQSWTSPSAPTTATPYPTLPSLVIHRSLQQTPFKFPDVAVCLNFLRGCLSESAICLEDHNFILLEQWVRFCSAGPP